MGFFYNAPASCRRNRHDLARQIVCPAWPLWAQVAQLVEQRTENPRVGGSNPPLGTIAIPVVRSRRNL